MLGGGRGRVSTTIRDLLELAQPGWSSPPSSQFSGSISDRIPEGSLFATSYDDAPRRPPAPATKKTTGGVHCDPEIGVGLLAAVVGPASARLLRVAEPVRAVVIAAEDDKGLIACNGKSGVLFRVDESLLDSCKLCRRRLDDRAIYLYMDKGFCMPECRYEYFREELYEQRRRKRAERTRASRRAWRNGKASLDTDAAADRSYKRIFFVEDDDSGPFP